MRDEHNLAVGIVAEFLNLALTPQVEDACLDFLQLVGQPFLEGP
jgi:hypothetical protein